MHQCDLAGEPGRGAGEVAQLDLERLDAAWADQAKAAHYHQPKDSRRKPQVAETLLVIVITIL